MIGVWTNNNPFNEGFTQANQEQNAREIWGYFQSRGWTLEAVSGMLGNIEYESWINPAQWETNFAIYGAGGFGLVQWTPWTKYTDWAGSGWESNYRKQLDRIQYELDNGLQWEEKPQYGSMSFYDFTQSTQTPEYLAEVFEYSYERGTWSDYRKTYARKWYDYLGGAGPIVGGEIPIWLLFKLKERYGA